jgi:hypothetical protein
MEPKTTRPDAGPSGAAVVWMGPDGAMVARRDAAGTVAIIDVPGPSCRVDRPGRYLVDVVDEVGDAARVVVMGSDALRLDLEREYVAIGHRPDRIVDVAPSDEIDRDAVLERLAATPG